MQADDLDTSLDPDVAGPIVDILGSQEEVDSAPSSSSSSKSSSSTSSSSSSKGGSSEEAGSRPRGPVRSASSRGRSALRKYIEGFDQATMIDTARVVSAEGAALVERQTTALFGDIKELTQQMQVGWLLCMFMQLCAETVVLAARWQMSSRRLCCHTSRQLCLAL
jgi:hypothetical protein